MAAFSIFRFISSLGLALGYLGASLVNLHTLVAIIASITIIAAISFWIADCNVSQSSGDEILTEFNASIAPLIPVSSSQSSIANTL